MREREKKVVELGSELKERSKWAEELWSTGWSQRVHYGTWFEFMVDYSSSVCRLLCIGRQNVFVPPLLLPSLLP